jgi:hypothetical protein
MKISRTDIFNVAQGINVELTETQFENILGKYDTETPEENRNLIIEMLIRDETKIEFHFEFDQKITTWMRTPFTIVASNIDDAKEKAIEFVKEGRTEELPWNEIEGVREVMSYEENFNNPTEELIINGETIYHNIP